MGQAGGGVRLWPALDGQCRAVEPLDEPHGSIERASAIPEETLVRGLAGAGRVPEQQVHGGGGMGLSAPGRAIQTSRESTGAWSTAAEADEMGWR